MVLALKTKLVHQHGCRKEPQPAARLLLLQWCSTFPSLILGIFQRQLLSASIFSRLEEAQLALRNSAEWSPLDCTKARVSSGAAQGSGT